MIAAILGAGLAGEPIMKAMEDRGQTWQEFEAMAKRPLSQRIRYGFIHTYKPVLDDAPYRSFDTMEQYRQWCETHLPRWLGFARV